MLLTDSFLFQGLLLRKIINIASFHLLCAWIDISIVDSDLNYVYCKYKMVIHSFSASLSTWLPLWHIQHPANPRPSKFLILEVLSTKNWHVSLGWDDFTQVSLRSKRFLTGWTSSNLGMLGCIFWNITRVRKPGLEQPINPIKWNDRKMATPTLPQVPPLSEEQA